MTLLELDELGRQRRDRFTLLYRTHYDAILGYAARRIDPATARDVAAETFLVVWRRPTAVPRDPEAVRLWLYGVARRTLANAERSRGRSERVAAKLLSTKDTVELAPDLADGVVERARIREALGSLSALDQETLRLVAWEGLDLAGAAQVMGCSRSLMAVRLHRARGRMAGALRMTEHSEGDRATAQDGPAQAVEEIR
ncbi:MAG TPA: sigma-70 family RNA polymerase sigma factor [Streptosporangiaceae bacterium]